jgi:hypothetical protein
MDAGEVNIKERISLTRQAYSVSKEKMKYNECGWSEAQMMWEYDHVLIYTNIIAQSRIVWIYAISATI